MEKENTEKPNRKKAALRKHILQDRNAILPVQRQQWDRQIFRRLVAYDRAHPCSAYLCYVSYKSEVSTKEFIRRCLEEEKPVFVPKVLTDRHPLPDGKDEPDNRMDSAPPEMEFYQITAWEELKKGYQGILEPEVLPERSFFEQFRKPALSKQMKAVNRTEEREGTVAKNEKNILCFRMLLPGAVFDKTGNRIGYGGGFYDRWLARWNGFQCGSAEPAVILEKIALAYKMQIVDRIPAEFFDQKADCIITEESVMNNIREEQT